MLNLLHYFAPAKINLFLHILGQKPNGYHNLQTIYQRLDFGDDLYFHLLTEANMIIECVNCTIAPTDNLIYKAAQLLQDTYQVEQGVKIILHKKIPMGAGLGGGSSDAASTLLALNQLWNLQLNSSILMQLGEGLGADVPFFILQQNAWAEGTGVALTPIHLPIQPYVLLYPSCHVDTKTAFQHPDLPRNSVPMSFADYQFDRTHNDFENLICQLYPEVKEARDWLRAYGTPRMTGSGSCLFLPVATLAESNAICQKAPKKWRCFSCKSY